jgi:hypothetical protein
MTLAHLTIPVANVLTVPVGGYIKSTNTFDIEAPTAIWPTTSWSTTSGRD